MLYYRKMSLQNRKSEATINLLTSLSGEFPDAEDGFEQVVAQLDQAFKYDDRVEMPRTFERFFYNLSRKPHQNLLAYCTEHREHLRERSAAGYSYAEPASRPRVMGHSSLEKMEGVLFYLLGQDYTGKDKHNHAQRWIPPERGRGHYQWNNYRKPATAHWAYDDELYYEHDTYGDEEDVYWEDEDNITYPDQPTEEEQPQDFNEEIYFDEDHEYTYDEDEEEAYATYIDARKKLAEHRSARGYYPVVALTDTNALPVTSTSSSLPSHGGRGKSSKGKRSKSKGKGCPQNSQPNSPNKRPKPADSMVAQEETAYLEDHVDQPYITGMQDGGASSVLCGHDVLMQLLHLHLVCAPPVFMAGYKGRIQTFIVEGGTPLLIGRPVLEALKVKIDYDKQSCRPTGEYLLRLDDGIEDAIHHDLTFDYMTNDVVTDVHQHLLQLYTLEDYILDTGRPGPILPEIAQHVDCTTIDNLPSGDAPDFNLHEGVTEPVLGDIPNKIWRSFDVALATWHNHVNFHLNQATKHKPDGKKVFWEVYAGEGNLSRAMADRGWIWDFTKSNCTKAFYQLLDEELPDAVWLAPPCKKWSRMQNINQRTAEQTELLHLDRAYEHTTNLKFTRRVYLCQQRGGRRAYIEQPLWSLAWNTTAFQLHRAIFDQCAYGAGFWASATVWNNIRKPTAVLSTEPIFAEILSLTRPGNHTHVHLQGHCPGIGSLTTAAAAYQPSMCEAISDAICTSAEQCKEHTYVQNEDHESPPEPGHDPDEAHGHDQRLNPAGILQKIRHDNPVESQRLVARLHRNLGHPTQAELLRLLEARGASEAVIHAVKDYHCELCHCYAKPVQTLKSTTRTAFVLWIQVEGKPVPVLTMLDAATRYMSARVLPAETSQEFLNAVQRGWVRTFGPPQQLQVDSHRAWCADLVRQWTGEHSIELIISPGEAHERLSLLERRHQVLRRAIDIFTAEAGRDSIEGLKDALDFTIQDFNSMSTYKGFTPSQWVLGYQPHNLLADADARLRRALLRQYRGNSEPLTIGMKVYYWRDAAGTGPKIKWKGPATIVMVETDNETGKPRSSTDPTFSDLRSRGTTTYVDLFRSNKRKIDDVSDDEDVDPDPKRPSPDHEPLVDYWEPAPDGLSFDRVHQFPRHQLFCPSADDPDIPYHRLGSLRHTEIYRLASDTGLPALEAEHRNDDWHQPFDSHFDIQHPWIGRTRFVVVNNEGDVTMGNAQTVPAPTTAEPTLERTTEPSSTSGSRGTNGHNSAEPSAEPEPASSPPHGPQAPTTTTSTDFDLYKKTERESFHEQRRRVDRQETISYGPSHRRGQRPGPYEQQPPDETADYAFKVDIQSFIEAKRKELASFFQNQVWEFSDESEAPAQRILRAHFILKWSKNEDGSPRAKARLITQGFKDPDSFSGIVERTSPTVTRLTRGMILSIAANSSTPRPVDSTPG
ncbi:unnamed protein product [Effrenium voratum]|nr:unnamed protein product [Effrenium voratum]